MTDLALPDDVAFDLARDPWELMNLYPRDTGLPMTVWAGPKGEPDSTSAPLIGPRESQFQ